MSSIRQKLISIVVPAFNEGEGIQQAVRTLNSFRVTLPAYAFEIIVIDDGSRDQTFAQAAALVNEGLPVRVIKFSRNFGKEAALLAGLQNVRGDAAITIDADLQHPPSLIPAMVAEWESGVKVIHGVKRDRGDESWFATARAKVVNAMLTRLGGVDVNNSSDFKLLDRAAVDILTKQLPERRRFYRGLADWIGLPQSTLWFDVAPREHGQSAWSLHSLISLTITAMVSFSSAPLRIIGGLGLLTFLLAIVIGVEALWSWVHGNAVSGFTTIIITLLVIGSSVMFSLGVIGEYIAKIYEEIKQRPTYIIEELYEGRSKDL